jgi:hypothetical protein
VARTDDEVIDELRSIYREAFAGKASQRYLISWADLRSLYGFGRLENGRFERLAARAYERGAYLLDLGEGDNGHMVAVVTRKTVDRWRKVPRAVVRNHLPQANAIDGDFEADEE